MILVTGSAGFIGSNLCYHLVNDLGADVIGIDKLGPESNRGWTEPLEAGPGGKRMIFRPVNLCEYHPVKRLFEEYPIEHVIHLAAESHVDRSITNPSSFWMSNVIGTEHLLHACHKFGVKTVINQITDEVYGERPDDPACEGDAFAPTSPYPCSKMAQYYVGKSYHTTYGLPVMSTFPVNCYGPRQFHEKLIPKFITKLMEGEKVPLMASTHFERDWLPVEDMCKAHSTLISKGVPGEDYNVGAFNHHTNMQITHKLLDLCGRDENAIEIVPDRKAHDSRYAVTNQKMKDLGWAVTYDFDDYLEYTVEWYREQL